VITTAQLVAAMPALPWTRAVAWADWLGAAMERFDVSTPQRQAAFLAQVAHESLELTRLQENLRYTTPERLRQIYGRRFWHAARTAEEFVNAPERLANFVYADRLGNGDEASGDGWRFRGRGPIQLTGRKNYRMAGDGCGWDFESSPDLVLDPKFGSLAAAWYWHVTGCNQLADALDIVGITQRINGPALAGLEDRQRYWMAAREALGLA
jgi:putative chitinase